MFTKNNIVTNTILCFSQRFTIISIHSLYRTIVQLHSLGTALNMYKRSQPCCCLEKYISFRKEGKLANLEIQTETQTRLKTNVKLLKNKKYKGCFILNVNTEELIRLYEAARMKEKEFRSVTEEGM